MLKHVLSCHVQCLFQCQLFSSIKFKNGNKVRWNKSLHESSFHPKKSTKLILVVWSYSQTCSNEHHYKITFHLRQPMLSPPKWIPIQLLLHKMTAWLMGPAATFLFPKWIGKHCITNECLFNYIYSIATL